MKKTYLGKLWGANLWIETEDKAVIQLSKEYLEKMQECPDCREKEIERQEEILGKGNSPLDK